MSCRTTEAGENVAALAGASDGALYAVSSSGRRLHWSGSYLAERWDIGVPKGARVRKVDSARIPSATS